MDAVTQANPPKGFDDSVPNPSWWSSLLITVLPLIIILGIFWFLMGQMQGGGSRVMNFGKSKARLVKDMPKVKTAEEYAEYEECFEVTEDGEEIPVDC